MPSIALPVSLRGQLLSAARAFSPASLFAASEPGIWLDPSDLTTMFQDRAGTTLVTTPGQTVGLRLDKSGNGNHAVAPTDAARPTYGIEPKTGRRNLLLATDTMATQSRTVTAVAHTLSLTGTGTVTLTGASIAGPLIGTGAEDRVSLTFTPTAGSLTLTVVGSVTLAQLELGSVVTNYQRVGTAFDVTEAGVPTCHYVQYDGTDDSFATPTITPGIDKVQVFAGVRKLSDATAGMVAETSTSAGINAGAFYLIAPESTGASGDFRFKSAGSINTTPLTSGPFLAPTTRVLSGLGDIAGNSAILRVDGSQVVNATADQGTGNYLAYPLYIGRRAGSSLPFNGRDYGLIVRFGANLDASTITAMETYLAINTSEVTL